MADKHVQVVIYQIEFRKFYTPLAGDSTQTLFTQKHTVKRILIRCGSHGYFARIRTLRLYSQVRFCVLDGHVPSPARSDIITESSKAMFDCMRAHLNRNAHLIICCKEIEYFSSTMASFQRHGEVHATLSLWIKGD